MEGCSWQRFGLPGRHDCAELELLSETNKARATDLSTIVIVVHGKERNAVEILRQARPHFSDPRSLVVAPHFLNGLDKEHIRAQERSFGPAEGLLVWKGNEWGEGGASRSPLESNISTFEVLDALLAHYTTQEAYPNVQRVMLIGHSLGAQLVQRYSMLGKSIDGLLHNGGGQTRTSGHRADIELAFVVMNPSTYMYVDERIPYKYGLAQRDVSLAHYPTAVGLSRAAIERRWGQRRVHYLHGERDNGVGDDRELAMEQGETRMERSGNWRNHLNQLGWPALHTFGYVPGVGHDAGKVMASSQFSHIVRSFQVE